MIQILGLLGVYFDAEVVEVKTFYFYSDWLWPYCDEEAKALTRLGVSFHLDVLG